MTAWGPGRVKTRVLALNTPILEKCILQLDAVSASSVAVSDSLRKHFRFGCSAHEFSHGLGPYPEVPPYDKRGIITSLAPADDEVVAAEQLTKMRRVSRVKVLRQRLGMTQAQFAEAFHLPITTLRDWEQHRSTPDAPARALLLAIERDPEVIRRLLAETAAQTPAVQSDCGATANE